MRDELKKKELRKLIKDDEYFNIGLNALNIGANAFIKCIFNMKKEQRDNIKELKTQKEKINKDIEKKELEMLKDSTNKVKIDVLKIQVERLENEKKEINYNIKRCNDKISKIDMGTLATIATLTGLSIGAIMWKMYKIDYKSEDDLLEDNIEELELQELEDELV